MFTIERMGERQPLFLATGQGEPISPTTVSKPKGMAVIIERLSFNQSGAYFIAKRLFGLHKQNETGQGRLMAQSPKPERFRINCL